MITTHEDQEITDILHIGKFYSPYRGGMESYVQFIAENIPLNQQVIVSNTENQLIEECINGVFVQRLPRLCQILSQNITKDLAHILRNAKTKIFHLHLPNPFAVLSFLHANPDGKLIITWHSDIIRQKYFMPFYRPFLNRILQRADKVIATSDNYLQSSPYLKAFTEKSVVIPLCISFDNYRITPDLALQVEAIKKTYHGRLVLFVGRLVYYKGVEFLIESAKRIDAQFIIIGDGPLKGALKKQAPANVVFIDPVEDLRPYYHACDLFVLPSVARSEAFGLVQLEAMACKKPIISTRLNTGVEFVNKFGLTIEPKNSAALTKGIESLLTKDNSSMVERNYLWGRQMFDAPVVNAQILSLYKNLLNDK